MSAAVSEPREVFSAPFLGSFMPDSTRSLSLRAMSIRLGGAMAPVKRFLRRIDLGVPRNSTSGGEGVSSGPKVAWRFLALPAAKASSSDVRGRALGWEDEGVVRGGDVEARVDVLVVFWELLRLGSGRKLVEAGFFAGSGGRRPVGSSAISERGAGERDECLK